MKFLDKYREAKRKCGETTYVRGPSYLTCDLPDGHEPDDHHDTVRDKKWPAKVKR